ncbi:uncharacterized protein B0P05DRAFT_532958, partial [Gilbertella persicaria]|uniref:uncharacterized protein n=1 Tax=Gilbertella persicaria TaxID=101096 RepID=UPI002220426B
MSPIEFLLHPPSPTLNHVTLPPISTLIKEIDNLPSLQIPSPTLSFASSVSSPSLSPLLSPLSIPDMDSLKRKRGRPPNRKEKKDHFTFITPTVCDIIQHPILPQERLVQEEPQDFMVLHWQQKNKLANSSTTPKKKRGRKP